MKEKHLPLPEKKEELVSEMTAIFQQMEENYVSPDQALEGCAGLKLYDAPVFGFAAASDPLFLKYKESHVVGKLHKAPREWLEGAQTVISFFLPSTERIRAANRGDPQHTADEWLHGRIEGQACINAFARKLQDWFEERNVKTCVPALDQRFKIERSVLDKGQMEELHFSSAWSERHAAYAAGLGTFCLTRGLISEKGVAGRYGSIIISETIEPDIRLYQGAYDNCIRCGACIRRCPVGAISLEHGKDQRLCLEWVKGHTAVVYEPRYGCGKCQVGVPCEARNPSQKG